MKLQYFFGYGGTKRDFVSWIDADELKRRIASAQRIAVIDVREITGFAVEGAGTAAQNEAVR